MLGVAPRSVIWLDDTWIVTVPPIAVNVLIWVSVAGSVVAVTIVVVVPAGAVVLVEEPGEADVVDVLLVVVVDVEPSVVVVLSMTVVVGAATAGGASVTRPRTAPTAAVAMRTLIAVAASQARTTPILRCMYRIMVVWPGNRVKRRLSQVQAFVAELPQA